jgi:ATP-dependent exoDNAse (exonuclease V) alpha subunit
MVPEHMKNVEWANDREQLWNAVETKENESRRAASAQLFREVMIPLANELSDEQKDQLVRAYVKEQFANKGMIADVSFHNFEKENPHAHIMLTMREVTEDGFGNKVRAWNSKAQVNEWRQEWTNTANRMAQEWGIDLGLDHRSYQERGIEKIPEEHMGRAALEMEARGVETEKGNRNREIQALNEALAKEQEQEPELTHEEQLSQSFANYLDGGSLNDNKPKTLREILADAKALELTEEERDFYDIIDQNRERLMAEREQSPTANEQTPEKDNSQEMNNTQDMGGYYGGMGMD